MNTLPFTDHHHVPDAAGAAAEIVAGGGVILLPTETFYGLGASPSDADAVQRIRELKGRPAELALPVLCSDFQQVEELVEVPAAFRVRLSRSWPAPLTVILPARRRVPASPGASLAVRIPAHSLLRALLYRLGPLTGTSANRHGAAPSTVADEALQSLLGSPDLVLDGGATPGGRASTLVDLTGEREQVMRSGAFPWSSFQVVR